MRIRHVGREARKIFHVYLYTFCFFESFEYIIYSIIMSGLKKERSVDPCVEQIRECELDQVYS